MSRAPDEDEPYYWGPANSSQDWNGKTTKQGKEKGVGIKWGKKHRQYENEH